MQLAAAVLGNLNEIPIQGMRANSLTELDLNGKYVGVEGGKVVAGLIPVIGGLTSLNLSDNQLCGLDRFESGTYTAEGITAIADSMRVNGALTPINLRGNMLGDEGWGAIFAAICGNKDSKIMSTDVSGENIGPAGVKLIAKALRTSVTGSLPKLSLAENKLGEEGTKFLCDALKSATTLSRNLT